jgi:hypothetical protein
MGTNEVKWRRGGGIRTSGAPEENIHEDIGKDTVFSVVLGHDPSRVVTSWDKLPAPLKAAILAIVNVGIEKAGL